MLWNKLFGRKSDIITAEKLMMGHHRDRQDVVGLMLESEETGQRMRLELDVFQAQVLIDNLNEHMRFNGVKK